LSMGQRVLVGYVGFVILFSVAAEIVGRVYGNNLMLYHLFTFVEFFVLLWLFRRGMREIPGIIFLVPSAITVGTGIWGLATGPFQLPDLFRTVEAVVLIGFSLLFFYNALRRLDVQR